MVTDVSPFRNGRPLSAKFGADVVSRTVVLKGFVDGAAVNVAKGLCAGAAVVFASGGAFTCCRFIPSCGSSVRDFDRLAESLVPLLRR